MLALKEVLELAQYGNWCRCPATHKNVQPFNFGSLILFATTHRENGAYDPFSNKRVGNREGFEPIILMAAWS